MQLQKKKRKKDAYPLSRMKDVLEDTIWQTGKSYLSSVDRWFLWILENPLEESNKEKIAFSSSKFGLFEFNAM